MLFELFFLQSPGGGTPPAGEGAAQPGGGGWQMLIMLGLIVVVFYFFMIRPQQRRQKQEQQFRNSMKKGDKVVSLGGIHGRIVSVDDTSALVEVDNGVKLKFEKSALRGVPEDQPAAPKK